MTVQELEKYLIEAKEHHGKFEASLKGPDTEWPYWYAVYVLGRHNWHMSPESAVNHATKAYRAHARGGRNDLSRRS